MNWTPLIKNDVVEIIAPGSKCDRDQLSLAIQYVRSLGLKPQVPKNIFAKTPYLANTDQQRLKQLVGAIKNPSSKAIWCLRGGYGCARLLSDLSRETPIKRQKLFIGYSDITALHLWLSQKWGWKTVHGPVLDGIVTKKLSSMTHKKLKKVLFASDRQLELGKLKPFNEAAKKHIKIQAPIYGGNLAIVNSLIGTPFSLVGSNRVLFFEDIGERGYQIDRYLVQLSQAGLFKKTKAVVFGDFVGGLEPDGTSYVRHALKSFAESQKIPVFQGLKVGHGLNNWPVVQGSIALIDPMNRLSISY